jgi:hypothetical protein
MARRNGIATCRRSFRDPYPKESGSARERRLPHAVEEAA